MSQVENPPSQYRKRRLSADNAELFTRPLRERQHRLTVALLER